MSKDYRKITDLRNWDKNPRSIKKDNFEELKNRITKRGQIKPLIITPDGEVLGGNMRLRAMQELDIKEAWVSVVTPTSEADKIEIALTDNEEMGYYEDQALAELIAQYKDEIDLTKYSVHLGQSQTLEEILKQFSPDEVVEDEAPEVADEAVSVLGEVYQLGRHRVMCGDSTKIEDVEKLMDGKKADEVVTDPPYNTGMKEKKGVPASTRLKHMFNDGLTQEQFDTLITDAFANMLVTTKGDAVFYVFIDWRNVGFVKDKLSQIMGVHNVIVWDKKVHGLGSDYKFTYEMCIVGKKGSPKIENRIGLDYQDIWRVQRTMGRNEDHATAKPIELLVKPINHASKQDDIVSDLFLGSGSTLIACEQTNRICYGMELDPKYVDVIRKRFAKFIDPDNWESNWQSMTPETVNKQ